MPYATGVASSPSWRMIGSACRMSRRYTTITDTISVTPTVYASWMGSRSGAHNVVAAGVNVYTANKTMSTVVAISASPHETSTLAIGKTSRGQYTLLSRELFVYRLKPPFEIELENRVHGSR